MMTETRFTAADSGDVQILFDKSAFQANQRKKATINACCTKRLCVGSIIVGLVLLFIGNIIVGWASWNGTSASSHNSSGGGSAATTPALPSVLDEGSKLAVFLPAENASNSAELTLKWDEQPNLIRFTVSLKSDLSPQRGLLIGFSFSHDTHAPSDGCFFQNGTLTDVYATQVDNKIQLHTDVNQNCRLIESKDSRSFEFSREKTTCDLRDISFDGNSSFSFVLGFVENLASPEVDVKNVVKRRVFPNSASARFAPAAGVEFESFNATTPVSTINGTGQLCRVFSAKDLNLPPKIHIVGFEALVSHNESSDTDFDKVSNIRLFSCRDLPLVDEKNPTKCPTISTCTRLLMTWTPGADGVVHFPGDAGLSLEEAGLLLSVRFDVPSEVKINSVGFQVLYTSELRPNNIGIIQTGVIPGNWLNVPPGQIAFPVTGFCISECTDALGSLTLVGGSFLTSTPNVVNKTRLSVIRQLKQIAVLAGDTHYSTSTSGYRTFADSFVLQPGDILATTCSYGTLRNFNAIPSLSAACNALVYAYPMPNGDVTCQSGAAKVPSGMEDSSSLTWTPTLIGDVLESYSSGPINATCLKTDNSASLFRPSFANSTNLPHPRIDPLSLRAATFDSDLCPSVESFFVV